MLEVPDWIETEAGKYCWRQKKDYRLWRENAQIASRSGEDPKYARLRDYLLAEAEFLFLTRDLREEMRARGREGGT